MFRIGDSSVLVNKSGDITIKDRVFKESKVLWKLLTRVVPHGRMARPETSAPPTPFCRHANLRLLNLRLWMLGQS